MSWRRLLLGWLCLMLLPVLHSVDSRDSVSASVAGAAGEDGDVLVRAAAAAGRSAVGLALADLAVERLLDGREVTTVKAIDRVTGEIVAASFLTSDGGWFPVLLGEVRNQAGAGWRAQNGALTPLAVSRLSAMLPGDTVDVVVWLATEIVDLPARVRAEPVETPSLAGSTSGDEVVVSVASVRGSHSPQMADLQLLYGGKLVEPPLPGSKIPQSVRAAGPRADPERTRQDSVTAFSASQQAATRKVDEPVPVPDMVAALLSVETAKAVHDDAVRVQLRPLRTEVLDKLTRAGMSVSYASEGVPMMVLPSLTHEQIGALARWSEIDALDIIPAHAGASLEIAGPTQNADLVGSVGYGGAGVTVAVIEGERAFSGNPYLTVFEVYDLTRPYALHPTGVSGIIRSTHPLYAGLASQVTLYSANGDYSNYALMAAAMDWGRDRATVLNNSWYWDSPNNPAFWAADRQLDFFVRYNRDFVAVAAGNFANGCGATGTLSTTYVVSPAKGYNVMSVGNYEDNDTLGWPGDHMSACSSFGDPGGDTPSPSHAKPEVAAVGSTLESTVVTTTASAAIGQIGSGTSYAAPMVAALAADLIGADPDLADDPEAVRALIMATALHNVEGDATLSDVDGVGGIVATAALASVERGNWSSIYLGDTNGLPQETAQFVYGGERVRFVISWSAVPTVNYATEPAPPDLDLRVFRRGDPALVGSSTSANNTFEIVDFIAPASDVYTFVVSLSGTWPASYGTYLGSGWWRGTYRIAPDVGYSDGAATPLGTHISVTPADWSPSDYWRAFAIRPVQSDHDLVLSSASWFEDPATRYVIATSAYSGTSVDYAVVDGNHWPVDEPEQYRIRKGYGTGGYYVSWSDQGRALSLAGTYGPYSMTDAEVVKVFDVRFDPGQGRIVSAIPVTTTSDLAMELFMSTAPTFRDWASVRGGGVTAADAHGVGGNTESLLFRHTGEASDWLGLVVINKVATTTEFYIRVDDMGSVYLPLILR